MEKEDKEKEDIKKAEEAHKLADAILNSLEEHKIEPLVAFSALGCAFVRLAIAMGHSKDSFKKLCNDMHEFINWE